MYQNSEEYTDEVISKFPHMYKRDKESNNYFLLKLYLEEIIQLKLELSKLFESLDLTTAKGFVVDKFGNTFNLRRNDKETDENFKIRILAEISKSLKNSTFDVLLDVLKIFVEDYKKNVFVFEEGIKKSTNKNININVRNGGYGGSNEIQYFEKKGGNVYILLNKALSYASKERIKNNLKILGIASGVKITLDFKYKVENYYYDSIKQNKFTETGISNTNIITKEGVK